MLTYEQQLKLVEQKLATVSINSKFSTFKYSKKVMYNYLWDEHPELRYCRGHTYDNTNGNIVTLPPVKSFNYLENDTWKDKPLDTVVYLFKKYNGFMAAASIYEGKLIVSTTGSTKSDYAKLAYERISPMIAAGNNENCTWLFEVCDPSDPHIVDDGDRVHYLGCTLHSGAGKLVFQPTGQLFELTLEDALEFIKSDKGEGYMMYDGADTSDFCKLKSPYYVGKKKLMRLSKQGVESMYNHPKQLQEKLPECWKFAVDAIIGIYPKEEWMNKTDQQRRVYLENIAL